MTRKTTAYARKRSHTRRADGITTARVFNTRLSAAERERILTPCRLARDAMQTATATYRQWVVLCTAVNAARAVEDGKVMTGQSDIIDAADEALTAIGKRGGECADTWRPPTCRGAELLAIQDLVNAHSRQLHEVTYKEYTRAMDLAQRRVASHGGLVFHAEITHPTPAA